MMNKAGGKRYKMDVKESFKWEEMKKENLCWEECDSLEDAIKGCTDLGKLFDLWQTAQIYETDVESSFPNLSLAKCPKLSSSDKFEHSLRSSFCPDGFLTEEETPKEKPGEKSDGAPGVPILFICRESNISDNIDNCALKLKPEDKQVFWLREVVRCRGGNPAIYYINEKACTSETDKKDLSSAKRAQTKYYNCLLKLLGDLEKENLIGKDEDLINKKKKLSTCAYLNINKRGGFASCDQSKLAIYAERYQMFIQKEIELIKPEKIVVCGELKSQRLQDTLEEIFRNCKKYNYWMYPKHPSRYTKDVVPKEVKLSKKE